jgi:hypothetical protein
MYLLEISRLKGICCTDIQYFVALYSDIEVVSF